MTPVLAGGALGTLAGAAGAGIAVATTSAPTDYAGIAMIIAACGSVIGTIGGLVIALRRRSTATDAAELLKALKDIEEGRDASP